VKTERKSVSSAHKLDGLGKLKEHAPRSEHVHRHQDIGHIRKNHFMPRCCLNFQSMRTQAESTYVAHNMFEQIKMEIPWYINRHTLISRKRDGKPRMIGGQFVVVRVGSTNSASLQTPLILCLKSAVNSCMVIACPV